MTTKQPTRPLRDEEAEDEVKDTAPKYKLRRKVATRTRKPVYREPEPESEESDDEYYAPPPSAKKTKRPVKVVRRQPAKKPVYYDEESEESEEEDYEPLPQPRRANTRRAPLPEYDDYEQYDEDEDFDEEDEFNQDIGPRRKSSRSGKKTIVVKEERKMPAKDAARLDRVEKLLSKLANSRTRTVKAKIEKQEPPAKKAEEPKKEDTAQALGFVF